MSIDYEDVMANQVLVRPAVLEKARGIARARGQTIGSYIGSLVERDSAGSVELRDLVRSLVDVDLREHFHSDEVGFYIGSEAAAALPRAAACVVDKWEPAGNLGFRVHLLPRSLLLRMLDGCTNTEGALSPRKS
jgi:hypothetical protein